MRETSDAERQVLVLLCLHPFAIARSRAAAVVVEFFVFAQILMSEGLDVVREFLLRLKTVPTNTWFEAVVVVVVV